MRQAALKGRKGEEGRSLIFLNVSTIGAVQRADVINEEICVYLGTGRLWTSPAPPPQKGHGASEGSSSSLRPHALPSHAFTDYKHIHGRDGVFCLSLGSLNPEVGLQSPVSL